MRKDRDLTSRRAHDTVTHGVHVACLHQEGRDRAEPGGSLCTFVLTVHTDRKQGWVIMGYQSRIFKYFGARGGDDIATDRASVGMWSPLACHKVSRGTSRGNLCLVVKKYVAATIYKGCCCLDHPPVYSVAATSAAQVYYKCPALPSTRGP